MRGNAIRRYFEDLFQGDPVALGITGLILFLLSIVVVIWIIDRTRKNREAGKKNKSRR